ncbi:hypothetical protein JD969_11600 [Planctomycetota bacterium]|nr:hypothetical protein JD969_11600 [Planctomycetota bacterium]
MSKPKGKSKTIKILLAIGFCIFSLYILIGEATHHTVGIDINSGRTYTLYTFFGMRISQTIHNNAVSDIYLDSLPTQPQPDWHSVRSTSYSPLTGSGYCRCYNTHNYFTVRELADTFKQYQIDNNQPYPKDQKLSLAKEAVEIYIRHTKGFNVLYQNNIITLESCE